MAWLVLIIAGLLEVVWSYSMKLSERFSRLGPSLVTVAGLSLSFALLAWSMRTLPLGTAYMIWTGIGGLGAFVIGITQLGETASLTRLLAAALILGGLVLLRFSNL